MPTYRYRCERCGDELDVWQAFSEDPLSTHDDPCGGRLVRVLTPAGIVLKGPGFYKTDSRSNGKRGKAKEPSDSSKSDGKPDSSSGSGGSKESKPPASTGSSSTGSSSSGSS